VRAFNSAFVSVCAAAALAASGCDGRAPTTDPARPLVRLITGPAGGTLEATGSSLQREYNRMPSGPTIQILHSGGALDNIDAIQAGSADLAVTYSDIAYSAYSGKLEQRREKFDQLAAVAVMQVAPLHIVTSGTSAIHDVVELRGGRIGMAGAAGSASGLTARLVLNLLGVPLSSITTEPLASDTAYARLKTGAVRAYLQVGLDPIDWIQRAIREGGQLVPLTEAQVDHLSEVYPFFRPTTIRTTAYQGLHESIPTVGVDGLLVCRRDMDEKVVYDLARGLFQALPSLALRDGSPFIDVEQAAAAPIPLHPGASRYYRERQLSR
jgi:TRAP transporter TAXI family solute receptor